MIFQKKSLCFFVPGTNSKQWIYGFAVDSVWHDTKMASVLTDDGKVTTVSRADIKNAALRMTISTKAVCTNLFLEGYTDAIKIRLNAHWDKCFARPQDERARILAESRAVFTARRARARPKTREAGSSQSTTNAQTEEG